MVSHNSPTEENQPGPKLYKICTSILFIRYSWFLSFPWGKAVKQLLCRVILETCFWFSRRNPNCPLYWNIYFNIQRRKKRKCGSKMSFLQRSSTMSAFSLHFLKSHCKERISEPNLRQTTFSHRCLWACQSCTEAAGTAGTLYTTGSIFNTKNMSVTGAHFIRTFFFIVH